MLAIRMQRTGRKGHAMFRVVVQDSRFTPTSGRVVAMIGSYDPHSKAVTVNKEKAAYYLDHGAQPSERVVKLLSDEGVKLPNWVSKPSSDKKRTIRNVEKLRRNRPDDPAEAVATEQKAAVSTEADAPSQEAAAEAAEAPAEPVTEATEIAADAEKTDESA